jgi:hypothetical protein
MAMKLWHQSFTVLGDLPGYEDAMRAHLAKVLRPDTVIGAQPRARRWRVLRTPAVKRATETTVLAPIRQGAGEL